MDSQVQPEMSSQGSAGDPALREMPPPAVAGTRHRSSEGCWTCRLRRKKCDEVRPVCAGCAALEIDCLYSDAKPDWMDNGELQKRKADAIKADVRRRAVWRRERRYMHSIENGTTDIRMTTGDEGEHVYSFTATSAALASIDEPGTDPAIRVDSTSDSSTPPGYTPASSIDGTPSASAGAPALATLASSTYEAAGTSSLPALGTDDSWDDGKPTLDQPNLGRENDLTFVMMYLDYVFPFLFPFYNPPILSSGRGWLLVLLTKSKALFHSAFSLATYYFSTVVKNEAVHHSGTCLERSAEMLQKQQELSLRELQKDVEEINRRGVVGYLPESVRLMASIVQLLCFDVAISSTGGSWPMHLEAAVVLFGQIMAHHGRSPADGTPSWYLVLHQLGPVTHLGGPTRTRPHFPDQAALRFYTAVLLFFDVIASTSLCQPPRLSEYHPHLLVLPSCGDLPTVTAVGPDDDQYPLFELDEFVGIQNWVVLALAQISTLAAWKRDATAAKKLSVVELVARARPIEQVLCHRLASELEGGAGCAAAAAAALRPVVAGGLFPEPVPPQYSGALSLVWGHATLLYLHVVVNGWQPEADPVRKSVDAVLEALKTLPLAACLRVAAWPFCVAGCLARRDQEDEFRALVVRIGGLEMFGSIKEGLNTMEAVWVRRDTIEASGGDWDFGMCFNVLGHGAFLI